ncbi:MAG: hypothetical protein IJP16_04090 [Clostridia bacterium]|nr:hypothetical protein [Clostridia bacterium]
MSIKDNKTALILSTNCLKIEISKKDATVKVFDLVADKEITAEKQSFFSAYDKDEVEFPAKSMSFNGGIAGFETELGSAYVKLEAFDDHFICEVVGEALKPEAFYIRFAGFKFECDKEDINALRIAEVPMTVNTRTVNYPSGISGDFKACAYPHLGGVLGAKVGVTTAPEIILRESLKTLCEKIDSEKGIVSKTAGPWGRDCKDNFGDYTIIYSAAPDYIKNNIEFFKQIGVDQVDIHQGGATYRQGDFKQAHYENHEGFKKHVAEPLAENGMKAGLHTYAYYINPGCHEILSDPKWQSQLDRNETFTLAEDISADADFVPSVESTAELSDYYGFFTSNLPYILVGEEIIYYTNAPDGFKVLQRGFAGTKAVSHKKGEPMYHLRGCFNLFAPAVTSDLFKQIARNTAEAYNKGGFGMIYLDALDGIGRHCTKHEGWYYAAIFVHEIMKNCETYPIIEYSTMYPSIWASRARMGAWDTPFRAYRYWNGLHHKHQAIATRNHHTATLGWYNFFPTTDKYPGNQHTRYHHWDSIDHLGMLAVLYNYSNVFNGTSRAVLERYAGYRRNVARYKVYSDLRKSDYFKPETIEMAKNCGHEVAVVKKGNKYVFEEKNYKTKRLFDIQDEKRNTVEFENPFKKQTPFIRIENCMSTLGDEPLVLLPLDENKPVADQVKKFTFGAELNTVNNLAYKIRVKGNGKKGAIGIKTLSASQSEHGYGLFVVDTDFEGWRDFVLLEADNGERLELGFEDNQGFYSIGRSGHNMDRLTSIELMVSGDVEGVYASSITACRQVYNVVKNPTVTVGKETVMFECELMSTDFIEWDGKSAKVIDRYGNEKNIWHQGTLTVPKGKFKASVGCQASLNACPVNVHLTFGTTGKTIKN